MKARAGNRASGNVRSSMGSSKGKSKRQPVDLSTIEDGDDPPRSRSKKKREDRVKASEVSKDLKERLLSITEREGEEDEEESSVFKKDFDQLRRILSPDNEHLRVDQASGMFFRASLAMVMDLMPIAEHAYRKTQKESAAYALTALINQARDLANDVRMAEDAEGQALNIKSIVNITFVGVAQMLLHEKFALQSRIDGITTNTSIRRAARKEIDDMIKSFTKGMQEHSNLLSSRVRSFLLGEANYMQPGESDQPEKKVRKKRKTKKNSEK